MNEFLADSYEQTRPRIRHKLSQSSLSLQVALYYNVVFAVFFVIVMSAVAINKLIDFNYQITLSMLIPWTIVEIIRLYYGFYGNLLEKVPELSTFLLISIFPQFPLVIYLGYFQSLKYPIDNILGTFMMLFLVFEIIFGMIAARVQIRSQTSQFMRYVVLNTESDSNEDHRD